MAAAAAMIDKIGSPHPISYIKNGKYSVSGHSVLRSETFGFNSKQAERFHTCKFQGLILKLLCAI